MVAKRGKKSKRTPKAAAAEPVTPNKKLAAKDAASSAKRDVPPETALARITELEADRANLMAQVAWARGVAQEQQKALDVERQRSEKLAADLEEQRARIEQLKSLSAFDRLLGRHKRI
jgi:hypothetical protein